MPISQTVFTIKPNQENIDLEEPPSYDKFINQSSTNTFQQQQQTQLQPGFNLALPTTFQETDSSLLPPPLYRTIFVTSTRIIQE